MLSNPSYFILQWNITSLCEYSCKYCYMRANFTASEEVNINKTLKQILEFRQNFNNFYINITGGNPLLHPEFEHIINELSKYKINIRVLGNPVTEIHQLERMKRVAKLIDYYQISIDGEYGNIVNRLSNDIEQRWITITNLHKIGIKTCVMLTLTDDNVDEVIPILENCVQKGVSMFAFSRVVRGMQNKNICKNDFLTQNYQEILNKIFYYLVENDIDIFSFKDSLWSLFLYERGMFNINSSDEILGCGAGFYTLCLMPNGNIQPCSRLPIIIGNIENDTLLSIWETNPVLLELRNFSNYENCLSCELLTACRGCRAIAYAESKTLFAKDPACWL